MRSSCIIELVEIYKYSEYEVSKCVGNSPKVIRKHYMNQLKADHKKEAETQKVEDEQGQIADKMGDTSECDLTALLSSMQQGTLLRLAPVFCKTGMLPKWFATLSGFKNGDGTLRNATFVKRPTTLCQVLGTVADSKDNFDSFGYLIFQPIHQFSQVFR